MELLARAPAPDCPAASRLTGPLNQPRLTPGQHSLSGAGGALRPLAQPWSPPMPSSALFGRGAILRRRKSRRRLLLASGISLFVLMIALPTMGETMTLPDGTMNNDHIEIDGHDLTVQVDGTAELSGI